MDSIDKFLIYDIIIMKTNSIFESWEKPGIFIWLFYFKFVIIFYRLPRAEIYYLEDSNVTNRNNNHICDYMPYSLLMRVPQPRYWGFLYIVKIIIDEVNQKRANGQIIEF